MPFEKNLIILLEALKKGNFQIFTQIVEHEALSLHALMMTSSPSYILLQPKSLEIILKIRQWREETKIPLAFTIDAGPNIHLIYPDEVKEVVRNFIERELWANQKVIHDEIGSGPRRIL